MKYVATSMRSLYQIRTSFSFTCPRLDENDGTMEPVICRKMLRNLSEKRGAKFSATALSYSMVKIARPMMLSQKCLNWKQNFPNFDFAHTPAKMS